MEPKDANVNCLQELTKAKKCSHNEIYCFSFYFSNVNIVSNTKITPNSMSNKNAKKVSVSENSHKRILIRNCNNLTN